MLRIKHTSLTKVKEEEEEEDILYCIYTRYINIRFRSDPTLQGQTIEIIFCSVDFYFIYTNNNRITEVVK